MKQNSVSTVVGVLPERRIASFYRLAHKCLIYVHKVAVLCLQVIVRGGITTCKTFSSINICIHYFTGFIFL